MNRDVIFFLTGFVSMFILLQVLSKMKKTKTVKTKTGYKEENSSEGLKKLMLTNEFLNVVGTNEFKTLMKTQEFSNYIQELGTETIQDFAKKVLAV